MDDGEDNDTNTNTSTNLNCKVYGSSGNGCDGKKVTMTTTAM